MSHIVVDEANLEATISHFMKGVPAALVFNTFSSAAHTRKWLPASGTELLLCDIDLHPGGRYQWQMGAAGKAIGPVVGGEYFQIIHGRRIIYSNDLGNKAADAPKLIADLTFVDNNAGSSFSARIIFATRAMMDAMVASGGLEEVAQGNGRLERHVQSLNR